MTSVLHYLYKCGQCASTWDRHEEQPSSTRQISMHYQFIMQSQAWILALILLFGFTLSEVRTRTISKRHTRKDWLIIPDTIAIYIYDTINKVSPEFGKSLWSIFENSKIQQIRSFLIEKTSQLTPYVEDLYNKVIGLWEDANWSKP
ncbi:apovitellenin-1-like [Rhinatrema bivittatum]|uniref:apovitellenin-1-like n=1 Tax=Rhinatrema bivittatum TaxID=194408 RepID=UPI00112CE63C|nr:apovitellenin-1-like [Rhinatrema bivittatum]